MKYDFETLSPRKKQGSRKWQQMINAFPGIDPDIVPLSVADMEFKNPPEIIQGLQKYLEDLVLGYGYATEEFKAALSGWMKIRHEYNVDPGSIVNTQGVVTSFFTAVKAFTTKNGGVVIMPPVYAPFFMAAERSGRKLMECSLINSDGYYTIDFQKLENIFKTGKAEALLFCSPHNPVGRVWKRLELEKTAELCIKYGIFLIADEIHHDIIMSGNKHIVMETVNPNLAAQCVTCVSLSKTFNLAGMGLSSIIIPDAKNRTLFQTELDKIPGSVNSSLSYKANEIAYNECGFWLDELIKVIEQNARFACTFIKKEIPALKVFMPEGTYLLWIDFRNLNMSNTELESFLQKKALLFLTQGFVFGEKTGSGFARINLAAPLHVIKSALARLKNAIENLKTAN